MGEVAEKCFTGTFTNPKLIEPLQIGLGIYATSSIPVVSPVPGGSGALSPDGSAGSTPR